MEIEPEKNSSTARLRNWLYYFLSNLLILTVLITAVLLVWYWPVTDFKDNRVDWPALWAKVRFKSWFFLVLGYCVIYGLVKSRRK